MYLTLVLFATFIKFAENGLAETEKKRPTERKKKAKKKSFEGNGKLSFHGTEW